MTEQQNIKWTHSWQDEYLKWNCGFANAQRDSISPRKAGDIDSCGRDIEKITTACTPRGVNRIYDTGQADESVAEVSPHRESSKFTKGLS